MQDGQLATVGAGAAAEEEVLAVAVSTGAVLVVADSTREALPVAVSTALVVSVGEVSAVALSTAVAFVVAVLLGATGVATGAITDSLMMSSSVATVTRGGGTGTIRTDTTVTAITLTITMDTANTPITDTAGTVTTVAAVTHTAMAADQGISGLSGGGDKPVRRFEIARLLVPVGRCRLLRSFGRVFAQFFQKPQQCQPFVF
jgi:hypothetical protein